MISVGRQAEARKKIFSSTSCAGSGELVPADEELRRYTVTLLIQVLSLFRHCGGIASDKISMFSPAPEGLESHIKWAQIDHLNSRAEKRTRGLRCVLPLFVFCLLDFRIHKYIYIMKFMPSRESRFCLSRSS